MAAPEVPPDRDFLFFRQAPGEVLRPPYPSILVNGGFGCGVKVTAVWLGLFASYSYRNATIGSTFVARFAGM